MKKACFTFWVVILMLLSPLSSPWPDQPAFKQAKLPSHWQRHVIRFYTLACNLHFPQHRQERPGFLLCPNWGPYVHARKTRVWCWRETCCLPVTKAGVVQFAISLTHPYPKPWPCHPPLHSCKCSSCSFEICDTWSTHQVSWVTAPWLLQLIQQKITEKSSGAFPHTWSFLLLQFFSD